MLFTYNYFANKGIFQHAEKKGKNIFFSKATLKSGT